MLFSHKLERGSSLTEINGEVFLSSVFTSPLTLPPSPQSPENFLLGEKTSLFHFQSPILSSFCPLLFLLGEKNKVNRCLARCSPCATTTDQPTNRAPNEPARPGKYANFGPNLDVFGQKIQIFTGEIKSFVTHITENPPKHIVHIAFCSGIGQNVRKLAIFGPK